MKHKKIILISIIGLLVIGFFSLYNSLDITNVESGDKDNYFNKTLKRIVPQNIKDFIRNTICPKLSESWNWHFFIIPQNSQKLSKFDEKTFNKKTKTLSIMDSTPLLTEWLEKSLITKNCSKPPGNPSIMDSPRFHLKAGDPNVAET